MNYLTDAKVTLDSAMQAHHQWKSRLQDAVKAGEVLDVSAIRRDDCCDLGKWLYSNGRVAYGHKPEFINLMERHNVFHLVASVVAKIINGKDYEQAKSMLEGSSQFAAASTDVMLAIVRLKAAINYTSKS